jgi:hypothetical protein
LVTTDIEITDTPLALTAGRAETRVAEAGEAAVSAEVVDSGAAVSMAEAGSAAVVDSMEAEAVFTVAAVEAAGMVDDKYGLLDNWINGFVAVTRSS